jgi:hypothetical protein
MVKAFIDTDIEVVVPKINHHFLQLPLTINALTSLVLNT